MTPYFANLLVVFLLVFYAAGFAFGALWSKRNAGFMGAFAFITSSVFCLLLAYSTLLVGRNQLEASYLYQENRESNFSHGLVVFVAGLIIVAIGPLVGLVLARSIAKRPRFYESIHLRKPGRQLVVSTALTVFGVFLMVLPIFQSPWDLTGYTILIMGFVLTCGAGTWAIICLFELTARPKGPNQ